MAGDVVRLLGEIPVRIGGSKDIFQRRPCAVANTTGSRQRFGANVLPNPPDHFLLREWQVQVRLRAYLHELANAGFWQKRPAVAAAEGLLTKAALKHACTEPLVLAQKGGLLRVG